MSSTLRGALDNGSVYLNAACKGSADPVEAFSLDISATHKTVRVRDSEQGLLGFEANNKLYF